MRAIEKRLLPLFSIPLSLSPSLKVRLDAVNQFIGRNRPGNKRSKGKSIPRAAARSPDIPYTLSSECTWGCPCGSRGAGCIQKFDDSRLSAIRITFRISLRSSSKWEPRYPLLEVVYGFGLDQLSKQSQVSNPAITC